MKHYPVFRFPLPELEIIPLGDLHIGAETARVEEALDVIKTAHPETRFLLLGDLIDNAIISSVGDTYRAKFNPDESIEALRGFFRAAGGRILGAVGGNHEERTAKIAGIDILKIICAEFEVAYSPDILLLDIQIGETIKPASFTVAMAHGYGGGRTPGGKVNAATKLAEVFPACDLYITGHTHQQTTWKTAYFLVDKQNKQIVQRERYHVVVPAWLGYEHYAANRFYPPSALGKLRIRLGGKRLDKKIRIETI